MTEPKKLEDINWTKVLGNYVLRTDKLEKENKELKRYIYLLTKKAKIFEERLKHNGLSTDLTVIEWETDQSAGSPTWDTIGGAAADDTIALGGYEVGFSSTLDEANHVVMKIDHTDADVTNATTIFQIQSVDDAPANLTYIKIVDDSGGTPNTIFQITADGDIDFDGDLVPLGNVDLGGSTSFELPNGTDPDVSITGQIYSFQSSQYHSTLTYNPTLDNVTSVPHR